MAWHVLRAAAFLVMVAISAASQHYQPRYEMSPHAPADKKYIPHIHSMMNAYRGELGRYEVESGLVDTKYRAWKRNADFINSILALPKGMNDAGR